MTLVVAIGCSDGVVMAADSAGTALEAGTKQQAIKIRVADGAPLIWGGSGDVGLIQKVGYQLESFSVTNSIRGNRKRLQQEISPVLRSAVQHHVELKPGHAPPTAVTLVAAIIEKTPCIIEIDADGRDTRYDFSTGNFAAIGSGKGIAHAVFRPFVTMSRDLKLGKIFAYRVLDDAIDLAAFGLAHPIHIYTLDLNGEVVCCDDSDLDVLKQTCEVWRELARDTVGALLEPPPAESRPPIPDPEN